MDATVFNQESVLTGYLDGLLSQSGERPTIASSVERTRASTERPAESDSDPAMVSTAVSDDGGVSRVVARTIAKAYLPGLSIQAVGVAGLNLALDRRCIAKITEFPEFAAPTQPVSGTIWLARLGRDEKRVHILNTAALVVPVTHPERETMLARCWYTHLVFLSALPVALAVENIGEEVSVRADQVHWRDERDAYPWLAAMLPSLGYALVDPVGLPSP